MPPLKGRKEKEKRWGRKAKCYIKEHGLINIKSLTREHAKTRIQVKLIDVNAIWHSMRKYRDAYGGAKSLPVLALKRKGRAFEKGERPPDLEFLPQVAAGVVGGQGQGLPDSRMSVLVAT